MAIDKKSKDRHKQLEFKFPKEKNFDKDDSNNYTDKVKDRKTGEAR